MNPRALALWAAAAVAVPLLTTNPVPRGVVLLVGVNVLLALARPGARLRPLALMLVTAAVTASLLDLLLSHSGAHVLLAVPGWVPVIGGDLTLESAIYGLDVGLGIAAGSVAVATLVVAVEPHELVDALPSVLSRTGGALAASLSVLPGVGRSAQSIVDAQRMRGWRPRGPRSWRDVAVPLLVSTMEDSIQLAEAMEARAYGSGPRTRFQPAAWRRADIAVAVAAAVSLVGLVAARVAGQVPDWSPYPSPAAPAVGLLPLALCLLLATPLIAWRPSSSAH